MGNTKEVIGGNTMITIKNINPNLGDVEVAFTQETVQKCMDEMSQAVRDCGYECIKVCEGVDFEVMAAGLPSNLNPNSVHYALDGPKDQQIRSLQQIIASTKDFGSVEATELCQEAKEALEELDA